MAIAYWKRKGALIPQWAKQGTQDSEVRFAEYIIEKPGAALVTEDETQEESRGNYNAYTNSHRQAHDMFSFIVTRKSHRAEEQISLQRGE